MALGLSLTRFPERLARGYDLGFGWLAIQPAFKPVGHTRHSGHAGHAAIKPEVTKPRNQPFRNPVSLTMARTVVRDNWRVAFFDALIAVIGVIYTSVIPSAYIASVIWP
jgi:hypothetical protein